MELTGKIILRAVNRKQETCFASPLESKHNGALYRGIVPSFVKESDREQYAYIPDETTRIALRDGLVLDPEDPKDKITIGWLLSPQEPSKTHPYIALDKDELPNRNSALFYVENKDKEAKQHVSKERMIVKAKSIVLEKLTSDQKINLAKVLGNPSPESLSTEQVEDFLLVQAGLNPKTVIEATTNEGNAKLNAGALVKDLIKYKVITRRGRGPYIYGSDESAVTLGIGEDQVVEFLMESKNKEILDGVTLLLKESKAEIG